MILKIELQLSSFTYWAELSLNKARSSLVCLQPYSKWKELCERLVRFVATLFCYLPKKIEGEEWRLGLISGQYTLGLVESRIKSFWTWFCFGPVQTQNKANVCINWAVMLLGLLSWFTGDVYIFLMNAFFFCVGKFLFLWKEIKNLVLAHWFYLLEHLMVLCHSFHMKGKKINYKCILKFTMYCILNYRQQNVNTHQRQFLKHGKKKLVVRYFILPPSLNFFSSFAIYVT